MCALHGYFKFKVNVEWLELAPKTFIVHCKFNFFLRSLPSIRVQKCILYVCVLTSFSCIKRNTIKLKEAQCAKITLLYVLCSHE